MVALGCSKNLVDAECMVKRIKDHGYTVVKDMSEADVAVINTCGFIESAKSEAIRAILDAADYKSDGEKHGRLSHIIVSGCLPQRYSGDILTELPEVDIVLGTAHYKDICEAIDSLYEVEDYKKAYVDDIGGLEHMTDDREISTSGYAWLKIGEGCVHKCAFCAIPLIRGKFMSRPMEDILRDAENIASKGIKEIILAAQDTCLPRDKGGFQFGVARGVFVKHFLCAVFRAVVDHYDLKLRIILLEKLVKVVAEVVFFVACRHNDGHTYVFLLFLCFFLCLRREHYEAFFAHQHVAQPEPHLIEEHEHCARKQVQPDARYGIDQFGHLS